MGRAAGGEAHGQRGRELLKDKALMREQCIVVDAAHNKVAIALQSKPLLLLWALRPHQAKLKSHQPVGATA